MATQDVEMQQHHQAEAVNASNLGSEDVQMSEGQVSQTSEYVYVSPAAPLPPPLPASGSNSWNVLEDPSTPVEEKFVIPDLPMFENVGEVLAKLEELSQEIEAKRDKLDAAEDPPPAGWVRARPGPLPSPLEQRVRLTPAKDVQDLFETINTDEKVLLDAATATEARDLTLIEFNSLVAVLKKDASAGQQDKNVRIRDLIRSYVPLKRQLHQERIWQEGTTRVKSLSSGQSTPKQFIARRPLYRCTECKAPHVSRVDIPVRLEDMEGSSYRVRQKACLNCGSKDKDGSPVEYRVEKIPHVSLQATHQGKEGVFYLDIVHTEGVDELEWTFYPNDGESMQVIKQNPVQVETLGVALPPAQNLLPEKSEPPCATDFIAVEERTPCGPCHSVEVLAWHPTLEEAEELRVVAADTLEEIKNARVESEAVAKAEQPQRDTPQELTLAASSDEAPGGGSCRSLGWS